MDYQINIEALLKLAYPNVPNFYNFSTLFRKKGGNDFSPETMQPNESDLLSVMGQPIIDPVLIQPFNYKLQNGGSFDQQSFDGLYLPPSTFMTIRQTKNIKRTKVQGRNGTVKEFISNGDFQVKFQGVVLDTDALRLNSKGVKFTKANYPYANIEQLNALSQIPKALPIQNQLLNRLGINYIVIQAFELANTNQFANAQAFSLSTISDEPFDIRLTNEPLNPNL